MISRADLSDGITSLSDAITVFGQALKQTATSVAEFTGKATRSYYDLAGKYTFPLPPSNNPTEIRNLGIGQIPLIIIPILPLATLSSLTWIPLIGNSATSIKTGFMRIISLPFLDSELNINDERTYLEKFYGVPGLAIGGCLGLAASAIILPTRILIESFDSCTEAYTMMLDFRLPRDARHGQRNLLTSNRHLGLKIGLGLPGVIVGTILGSIGLVTYYTMRGVAQVLNKTFTECAISCAKIFTKIINLALPSAYPLTFEIGPRKKLDIVIGLPGFILGCISGVIDAAIICIARAAYFIVKNNVLSFMEAYIKVANLSLAQNYQLQHGIGHRNALARYGAGFIGGVLGGICGIISDLIIFPARDIHKLLCESAISYNRVFIRLVNLALPAGLYLAMDRGPRNKLDIAIGIPGFIFGAISGVMVSAMILAARSSNFTLRNIALSFAEAFILITNLSLPLAYKWQGNPLPRHPLHRFGVGLIGLALGGVCGAISSLVIFIARGTYHALSYAIKHTTLSFAVLSGSLLNVAANRVLYAGLAGDTRSNGQKAIGMLGYVMALGITAPIATCAVVVRNATIALGVSFAFICSPIILLTKLVGLALTSPRFNPQETSPTDMQFRRLYSSLSAFGNLPANKPIVTSGSGKDNAKLFMWKATKLNLKTPTERTLDALLAAHRNYRGNNFVNSQEFQAAVTNLKNRTSVGFFTSTDTVQSAHYRIDKTAEFVADFLQGNRNTPPVIKAPRSSWFGTFYGKKTDQAHQAAIHAGMQRQR